MKTAKQILVIFLSLLLIYVGGGASVVAYCLSGCKPVAMENCCCCKVTPIPEDDYSFATDPCCKSAVYQIDLLGTSSTEAKVFFPLALLPQKEIIFLSSVVEREEIVLSTYYPPPKPDTSRFYLHYFSTLLI